MKPRVMAELLAQYVDRTNMRRDDTEAYLSLFAAHRGDLAPLFATVKLLKRVLIRTEPSASFVDTLGKDLRLAAQQAVSESGRDEPDWPVAANRRSVLWGAAALGSIASVAAIVLLSRARAARTAA